MDGRWKSLLVGGVLCGLIGCSHFRERKPKAPSDTGEPPLSMTAVTPAEEKRGPVAASTYVALATVKLHASIDENRSSTERDDLQNQARLAFEQALKRDAKNLEAMLGMARMYAVVNDKDRCLEWYQKAAKLQPANGAIYHEMGMALAKNFKDRDAALKAHHLATKTDPENREYRKTLGFTLARAGRYEEAYAWLSRAMPEAQARVCLGRMMDHNGDHDQASQQFAAAAKTDPSNDLAQRALMNKPPAADPLEAVNYEQYLPASPGSGPKGPSDSMKVPTPGAPAVKPKGSAPMLTPTNGWDK